MQDPQKKAAKYSKEYNITFVCHFLSFLLSPILTDFHHSKGILKQELDVCLSILNYSEAQNLKDFVYFYLSLCSEVQE